MKKQLAVLMAAATAVTTVAPAVVNAATVNTNRADALAKVEEALKVRYTDPAVTGLGSKLVTNGDDYLNSVYKFAAMIDGKYVKPDGTEDNVFKSTSDILKDSYPGFSLSDITSVLNYAELHGKEVTIEKYDKGHRVVGNNIFANQFSNFMRYTFTDGNDAQSIHSMFTKALYLKKDNKYVAPDYLSSVEYNGNTYVLKQITDDNDLSVLVLKGMEDAVNTKDNAKIAVAADKKFVVVLKNSDKAKIDGVERIDLKNVLKLNLASGATKVISDNDDFVLNFRAAIDKDGKTHNLFAQNAGNGYADKIIDFGKVETGDGSNTSYDLNTKPEAVDKYIVQQFNKDFNVKDIYTVADGYSAKGADFVNNIIDASKEKLIAGVKFNKKAVQFNFDGKRYAIEVSMDELKNTKVVKDGDKAVFYIKTRVLSVDDIASMGDDVQAIEKKITSAVIRVESASELEASTVLRDIVNGNKVVAGRRNVLAGADRFKTAIEISKASYEKGSDAVVLVGQFSTVDGLAAAPFAKSVKAPILLSQFDKITPETVAEIKRLIGKDSAKKVYIVGGEKTISKAVEKQLIDELNIRSERIEGKDRFETSRKLSKALLAKAPAGVAANNQKVFVVGAEAEADAMSASAVAARDAAPIVVVPKDKLDLASKEFINEIGREKGVFLVGGVNSASEQVRKDLIALTNVSEGKVERIAGADRQETNAEVINRFYKKADGLFVAKSDNKSLVDALAAGPLAGEKKFPIVLATTALNDAQKTAVRNHVVNYKQQKDTGYANVYEIGMGINAAVMSAIYSILGL